MRASIGGLWRYALASALVLAALAVKLALRACWGTEAPFLLFLAAVLFSAWRGGLGPGLLATALSVLAAHDFFLVPFGQWVAPGAGRPGLPPTAVFAAEAAVICVVSGLRKRDRDLLRARTEELGTILHSIDSALLTTDAQGQIAFLNPAAQVLAPGARPGLPLPDELPQGQLRRALAGRPCPGEEVHLGEGPGAAWLRVRAAPIRGRDGAPAGAVVVLDDVTRERRADHTNRCGLLERLATIQEDERRHLARDLHDEAGQQLTALALGLKAAREKAGAGPLGPRLMRLQALAEETIGTLHRLACRLRPAALDGLGLEAALRQCLSGWAQSGAPPVDFQCSLPCGRLPAEVETHVYRIVNEAFANVVKHAAARRVGVILQHEGKQLLAIVEDDGRGFDLTKAAEQDDGKGRLGLYGMRERAALMGGTVEVESAPGRGTTVFVRVPLPAAPGGEP